MSVNVECKRDDRCTRRRRKRITYRYIKYISMELPPVIRVVLLKRWVVMLLEMYENEGQDVVSLYQMMMMMTMTLKAAATAHLWLQLLQSYLNH